MNHNNQSPPRPPADDVIQAHIGRFMAELRKADYAAETLAAKHTALKQFVQWRHWRQGHALRVTESEIGDFLTRSFAGDHSRRSVAFRALIGFLDYLRRCGVIKNCVRKDRNAGLSLEARYADFLRRDKGLAELSLKVYLPVAKDLVHYLKEQHGRRAIRRLDAIMLRAFLLQRAQGRSIEYVDCWPPACGPSYASFMPKARSATISLRRSQLCAGRLISAYPRHLHRPM